jgi:ATP-dependent protease ClpP protease subunit
MMKSKRHEYERAVYFHGVSSTDLFDTMQEDILARDQVNVAPIRLFLNSEGGDWFLSKLFCEFLIHLVRSPIITIVENYVESSAAAIVGCGTLRLAMRGAKFGYHYGIAYDEFKDARITEWSLRNIQKGKMLLAKMEKRLLRESKEYMKYMTRRGAFHLNKCNSAEKSALAARIKQRDVYEISAKHALKLGLIDAIVDTADDIDAQEEELLKRISRRKQKNR